MICALSCAGLASSAPKRMPAAGDGSCRLTTAERDRRAAAVARNIRVVDGAIQVTEDLIENYEDMLRRMNTAYLWSRRSLMVSTAAGIVTGASSIYTVFFLGRSIAVLGIQVVGIPAKIYVGGHTAWNLAMLPRDLQMMRTGRLEVDPNLEYEYRESVDRLVDSKLISTDALRFISDPDCGVGCSFLQPELERAYRKSVALYNHDLEKLRAEDRWWRPDAYTHLVGRELSEVHLPWNQVQLDILRMKKAFSVELLKLLRAEGDRCSGLASQ